MPSSWVSRLMVIFQGFPARAWTGGGNGIRCCHEDGFDRARLCVSVVREDGIENTGWFAVLAGDVCPPEWCANLRCRGRWLCRYRGADRRVLPASRPHQARRAMRPERWGNFNGMLQHILAVAGAILQAAKADLDQLWMQLVDTCFKHGLFAPASRMVASTSFCALCHHFFDAGWMDAAVDDELFKRHTGDFARIGSKQE